MSETPKQTATTMRERILAAAAQEFAELGFDGARVDSIAHRAKVGKAMVYYHVGDKSSLYETVFSRCLDRARAVLDQPEPAGSDPGAELRRFVRAVVTAATADPGFPPLLLREVAAGGANLPATVIARIGSLFQTMRQVLVDGQASGMFRAFDPLTMQALIGGSVMFFTASAALRQRLLELGAVVGAGEEQTPARDLAEEIAELFLSGLLVRGPGERARESASKAGGRPRGEKAGRRRPAAGVNEER